jgi:Tol biopolymer transport system component
VAHKPGVGTLGNPDVWVMKVDGSGLRNVTRSDIYDSAPDWGSRASRRP